MSIMKKLFSIILSAAVCMMLFTGTVNADSADDIYDMAEALNNLNILQGSNGDYMLDSNLLRSQAVALITRMLGKEIHVKQNADELKYTKYPDVPSDSWYAPYVGFGTINSIVAGDPSGNFLPNGNVSEKAFIKMALCALEYEYGVDFNWSDVYQKAYEVGLVTDPSYSVKTADNTDYLRAQTVEVIFRSLNTYIKDTQTKLVFSLVDAGIFTNEELLASGIFGDDTATEINEINALTPNNVEVKLNESIQSIAKENVTVIDSSDANSQLEVKLVSFTGNSIQIITAGQIPGKSYNITIDSVADINGNISGKLEGTFKGYSAQNITSDFFRISKVEQIAGNVINVYFTHPVDISSETSAYYELYENGDIFLKGTSQNMTVKRMQSSDYAVSIFLKENTLKSGEVYSLKGSGRLTSLYGVTLRQGQGETMDFVATKDNTNNLQVSSVQASSSNTVRIAFNTEVDSGWAGKRLNYTIHDEYKNELTVTNAVVSLNGENSGSEVQLSLATALDKTRKYELKVEYIPDAYKQSTIENKAYPFSGMYSENSGLVFTSAFSEQNNSVVLTFNKALDAASAMTKSNYTIRSMTDSSFYVMPEKIYYSESNGKYSVKLFLSAGKTLSSSQKYVVNASNLKDSLGTVYTSLLRFEFTGSSSAVKPQIIDAVTISEDAVKLTFNVEIAFNQSNISSSNYMLEYTENAETLRIVPYAVNYISATTMVLRFNELDPANIYLLRYNTLTDYSELYTRTTADGFNVIDVRWGK